MQENGISESFFGVYDGHGGAEVALYCSRQFHIELRYHPSYRNNLPAAMKGACSRIDAKLKQSDDWRTNAYPPGTRKLIKHLSSGVRAVKWPWKTPYLGPLQEGSTACVTVVRDNQIIVGNIGDTRCVLSMGGEGQVDEVCDITTDHKPHDEAEEKRIVLAGGKVYKDEFPNAALKDLGIYRINGKLHISRAIGYFEFKQSKTLDDSQQMVTSNLDTFVVKKNDSMEFLLTASRGIWSIMTSQEAVESVRTSLQSGKSLRVSCEELLDECMRLGSKENLTVILIQFKSDRHSGSQAEFDPDIKGGSQDEFNPEIKGGSQAEFDQEIKEEHNSGGGAYQQKTSQVDHPEDKKNKTNAGKGKHVACFGIEGKASVSDKGSKGCFNMKGLDGFKGCFQGRLNYEKGESHKGSKPPPLAESPKKSPPPSAKSLKRSVSSSSAES
uniref:protein-serine/threonine phosphatase n=1 Tax=Aegilops tauschii subsp. strangulata TaxID=200361 RepID=A0A453T7S8_AEGTS